MKNARSVKLGLVKIRLFSPGLSLCACSTTIKPLQEENASLQRKSQKAQSSRHYRTDAQNQSLSRIGFRNKPRYPLKVPCLAAEVKALATVGITPHPTQGTGTQIQIMPAASDPEGGFVNDEAIHNYRRAMILFEALKYPEAILAFSGFLEKYPDHPLAGSSQYYVAAAYNKQKEYKIALEEYQRVLTSYDRSSHVPETLRDMGEIEQNTGRKDDAARHKQLLMALFPHSPAAADQKAERTAEEDEEFRVAAHVAEDLDDNASEKAQDRAVALGVGLDGMPTPGGALKAAKGIQVSVQKNETVTEPKNQKAPETKPQ